MRRMDASVFVRILRTRLCARHTQTGNITDPRLPDHDSSVLHVLLKQRCCETLPEAMEDV
jgi:hypothetical protein